MFIDEAHIRIKAGDGGNGCMAFRREKFVPRGGPSGGDGGHGGDILMRSSLSHNTLIHFRFNPEWKSERGGHGLGSNMSGSSGEPTVLNVPVGTLIYDEETGELLHDFTRPNEEIVIARGGRGGRGNQHFATSTHQAPREHELGRPGEARNYRLELRLLADAWISSASPTSASPRLPASPPRVPRSPITLFHLHSCPTSASFRSATRLTSSPSPSPTCPGSSKAPARAQASAHNSSATSSEHPSWSTWSMSATPPKPSEGNARPDPVEDFKIITAELKASLTPH